MSGQPLNATFFAFKKRDRGGVLMGASLAYLVITVVVLGAFIALNYQGIGEIVTWYGGLVAQAAQGHEPDPQTMTFPAGLGMFALTLIPFMFVFYVLFAAYEAACLRWMLRGETGGLFGLTLGADTWRVYAGYWIWFGLYIALSIVFTFLTFLAMGVTVFSGGGNNAEAAAMPAVLLVSLVRLIIMLFFAIRLAPAAATSVGLQKFSFFKAWTVTKGRFWALLGAFLIVVLIAFVGEIIFIGALLMVIGASVMSQIMSAGANPSAADVEAILSALMTPQNAVILIVAYAILLVLSLIIYVLFFGINARAVQAAIEDGKIGGAHAEGSIAPPGGARPPM